MDFVRVCHSGLAETVLGATVYTNLVDTMKQSAKSKVLVGSINAPF